MPISQTPISGGFSLSFGDLLLTEPKAVFRLSGYDVEGNQAVPPMDVTVVLDANQQLPPGFALWPNTAGLRGTRYIPTLRGKLANAEGVVLTKAITFDAIQIGNAASYDLGELLDNPVPDAPGWNVNLDPALYAALLADIADVQATRDQSVVFVSQDATSATLAVGAAVIVGETDLPFPSVTMEFQE